MPRRITTDAMSWIMEALCTHLCESSPFTPVEMPWANSLIALMCLRVVSTHCAVYQLVHRNQHMTACSILFPSPETCLADSHSIAGAEG